MKSNIIPKNKTLNEPRTDENCVEESENTPGSPGISTPAFLHSFNPTTELRLGEFDREKPELGNDPECPEYHS